MVDNSVHSELCTRSGCIKLSVLPLSMRQLTVALSTFIFAIDLVKDATIDAMVGYQTTVDVLCELGIFG